MPQDYWVKECIHDKDVADVYEIDKELGSGATSKVYKCHHRGTGQPWAIKVIDKKPGAHKAVSTEIGILFKISHPNIIRLKEVYETTSTVTLVLELVTGGELFDRIVTQGYYSEKDAAKCVNEMLQAIKLIHEQDIVHRDLKPENLLYEDNTDESKLKIADFGLSKIMSGNIQMQTVCGTPGYCAPEVINPGKEGYSKPCDMWSIGVITYILLCGYEPFYDENERIIYKKILKNDFEFDSPYWDDVGQNAKDLISKLLVLNPAKRLTAAQALRHPWVAGVAAKGGHMEETQTKLKELNVKRKLKAATNVLRAFNLLGMMGGQDASQVSQGSQECDQ